MGFYDGTQAPEFQQPYVDIDFTCGISIAMRTTSLGIRSSPSCWARSSPTGSRFRAMRPLRGKDDCRGGVDGLMRVPLAT